MCYAAINSHFHGIFFKLDEFNEQKVKYPNGKYKKCNSIQEAYNYILNNRYLFITEDIYNIYNTENTEDTENTENTENTEDTENTENTENIEIKNEYITSSTNASINISINDNNKIYYAYTDGACSSNGFLGAKAGYGIYFGEKDPRNVSKRVEGKQTNNIAELTAIIEAYKIINTEHEFQQQHNIPLKKYCIVTDSIYAIRCATTYGEKCEKDNWKKDIPNKDLVKEAYYLFKDNTNITLKHVIAHTKNTDIYSIGNSYADELARQALEIV